MITNPYLADVQPGEEIEGFYLLTNATVRTSSSGGKYTPQRFPTAAAASR